MAETLKDLLSQRKRAAVMFNVKLVLVFNEDSEMLSNEHMVAVKKTNAHYLEGPDVSESTKRKRIAAATATGKASNGLEMSKVFESPSFRIDDDSVTLLRVGSLLELQFRIEAYKPMVPQKLALHIDSVLYKISKSGAKLWVVPTVKVDGELYVYGHWMAYTRDSTIQAL